LNIVETERLKLRQLTVDDAAFIVTLLNDPAFMRNIGDRGVRSAADARHYILNGPAASYKQNGFGLYLVALKESETPIGMCGLVKRPYLSHPDIGYAFLPAFWSKGYAVESATAVKEYALNHLEMKRVLAIVNPDNEPSIRVLQKIGLTFERMIRPSDDALELKLFAFGVDDRN